MFRRLVLVSVLAALAAPSGCKKSAPAVAPVAVEAGATASAPAARGAAVLERVPADALAALVVSSPSEVAEKLGRAEVAEALGATWVKAAAGITLVSGHNLLDPAMWSGFGVDPSGPAGAAWLHARDEVVVFFVTVSEPNKLISFVKSLMARSRGEAREEKVGDATLLWSSRDEKAVLVLAPGGAWLVVSDRRGEPAIREARRLAALGKDASLGKSERFGAALDKLAFGGHATVWLDTRGLIPAYRSFLDERKAEAPPDMGESPEAAVMMRDEQARWRRRAEAEFALIEGLVGGFDAVAVGIEVNKASIEVKAWGGLREGSLLARGLKNGLGVSPILRSLSSRPLFAAGGVVEPAVALEALALVARADGDDLDEKLGDVKRELGIDVRSAFVDALDGRAGFAVTGDLAKILESASNPSALFGGSVTLGVKNAAKVKATLDALWAAPGISRLVTVAGPGERARFAVPEWRDVHVGLAGDVLLITTDAEAFDRLVEKGRGPLLDAESKGPLGEVLGAADTTAVMAYDHGLAALANAAFRFDWTEEVPDLAPDASAAMKSAHAELLASRKRSKELKKQLHAIEDRAALEITRRLGTLVASARVDGGAVVLQATQMFDADSLPNAVATIARTVVESEEETGRVRRELWRSEDRGRELSRPLQVERHSVRIDPAPPVAPPTEP